MVSETVASLCTRVYVIFSKIDRLGRNPCLYGNDTLAVCKACDVSIREMVDFLDTDREHMQHGLFPDVQRSYVLHSTVAFDEVIMWNLYFYWVHCFSSGSNIFAKHQI